MNILFTICGRAGSKGVKNKNIKEFLGIPLVYYSLAAIKMCKDALPEDTIVDIALNTDSEALVDLVKAQHLLDVDVLWREESLGTDKVPKVAVIKDCYQRSSLKHNYEYDTVVDLDITSPLRTKEDVVNAINTKISREDCDAVYSVTDSRRNPHFNMVKEENGYFTKAVPSTFTTRQEAPEYFDMNASIYAYGIKALKEKPPVGFFNTNAYAIKMKDTAVLDIDSEEDFELMEVIGKYLFEKYPDFAEIQKCAEAINKSV